MNSFVFNIDIFIICLTDTLLEIDTRDCVPVWLANIICIATLIPTHFFVQNHRNVKLFDSFPEECPLGSRPTLSRFITPLSGSIFSIDETKHSTMKWNGKEEKAVLKSLNDDWNVRWDDVRLHAQMNWNKRVGFYVKTIIFSWCGQESHESSFALQPIILQTLSCQNWCGSNG